jgi:hypothetical protein
MSRNRSGIKVTDFGLDDLTSSSGGCKDFSSVHHSYTFSGSHWASHNMDTKANGRNMEVFIHFHIVTILWLYMGFGLIIGFIELLQLVTTSNYNALANPRTRLLTTAHTKSS